MSDLIYLACPYTKLNPMMRSVIVGELLDEVRTLIKRGHNVFSPITYGHTIVEGTDLPIDAIAWSDINLAMLDACSEMRVYCVDGWEESTGVQAEIALAKKRDMPIYLITPLQELSNERKNI